MAYIRELVDPRAQPTLVLRTRSSGMVFAQAVPGQGDAQAHAIPAIRAAECAHVGPDAELRTLVVMPVR